MLHSLASLQQSSNIFVYEVKPMLHCSCSVATRKNQNYTGKELSAVFLHKTQFNTKESLHTMLTTVELDMLDYEQATTSCSE